MRLFVFLVLTLSGMGAGLIIGLASMPSYQPERQGHMIGNTVGGTLGGAFLGAVAVYFSTPAPPRRKE